MNDQPIRVAVWSTGGIGSSAIAAISRRPDLDLVGVWVHTPEKVGRDAGVLAGGPAIGLAATDDVDALLALRPDCIVYAASGPARDAAAVPDYERFLTAGVNIVTTTSTRLVFPPVYDPEARDRLAGAAAGGGASLYASGIFPGFASDQLALVATTQSSSIRTVRATEISLNDHYPVASAMVDGLGFGRPMDFGPKIMTPGFIPAAWRAPIALIASGLGVELDEVRGRYDRSLTDRPIEVAFGTVEAGTVGAVRTVAIGVVDGREAIVIEHVIRMARHVAPEWPSSDHDATYQVNIDGEPDIELRMSMGEAEGHAAGNSAMLGTAMRVVNAVPYVVAAPPGLLSSLDLPLTLPRHAFG
ncbi:MAG TPA: hypothetical protein VFI47_28790 [Acidimicrobiales bacterium]|nr:hypothetical protein [Acidimicrobiales bacterium]